MIPANEIKDPELLRRVNPGLVRAIENDARDRTLKQMCFILIITLLTGWFYLG